MNWNIRMTCKSEIFSIFMKNFSEKYFRNNSVSPINQILTALRFYASSGHLSTVADFMGIHESTASRIVEKVSRVLASQYRNFVRLPRPQEIISFQTNFYEIARFPRIVGIVDGTHIKIQSPGM